MTHAHSFRLSALSLPILLALATTPVWGQNTSAELIGAVNDESGRPLADAVVTIRHDPSGTLSHVTTDAQGHYDALGLRVGGPYSVTVTKQSGTSQTKNNVYLSLGQATALDMTLAADINTLATVAVTSDGGGSAIFSATKMGSGTSIDSHTIASQASVNGNIQDYMRLDPHVSYVNRASGMISAAGLNPRYNAIRIDGVAASDIFGLEGNNMPTRRQPVSMEAIEAINVDVADYDVTVTGAAGAVVDAVTKSGTNTLHGSVYGTLRKGQWVGHNPTGNPFNGFNHEETAGATIGGPLRKDRLFFFVNVERFQQKAPGADLGGSAIGLGKISPDQLAQAQTIFNNRYGMNAGGIASNGNTSLDEAALKLDWNLSDHHRANVRVSQIKQEQQRINGYGRPDIASFSSYWYQQNKTVNSVVAQSFSDWSDAFSTEMKASYRDVSSVRVPPTHGTPAITLSFGPPSSNNGVGTNPSLYLGTETNTQYNRLRTKTGDFFAAGTWRGTDHTVKFGGNYSRDLIDNLYAPYVDGAYYTYNSLADFAANTPSYSQFRYPHDHTIQAMEARFHYSAYGLFVQDQWAISTPLTMTFGLRADRYNVDRRPSYNAQASSFYGYNNTGIGDTRTLWQPRVGFNYTFASEQPTQLHGGLGLFQGSSPMVWLANSYNTTGLNYDQKETYAKSNVTAPTLRQNINFIGPRVRQPSVWKTNLAFDHQLPWHGIVASTEVLLTQVNDALYYQRLDIGAPTLTGQDGRYLYWKSANASQGLTVARANRSPRYGDVIFLDGTHKGRTGQWTASLSQPADPHRDWSWSLGYTYTTAKEVSPLTSATATSGWNTNLVFQDNEATLSTSNYEMKHRVFGTMDWQHAFIGNHQTHVGLYYEGRSGRPYSWVYSNDMNGDGATNDLFYVPKGRGDVRFTGETAMENAFFEWLKHNPRLAHYSGAVAPKNSGRAAWINTFDLRILQELGGLCSQHQMEIWLDIRNIGNILNHHWGRIADYGNAASQNVARFVGIDPASGKYVYDFTSPTQTTYANADSDGFNSGISQWSLQIGFRYKF